MGVDCDQCGDETDDPLACGECGGVYCHDHEDPLTHGCPALDDVVADDAFDPTAEPHSRSVLRRTAAWSGVVVATVAALAVVGVATGLFTPAAVVDAPGESDAPTGTPTVAETDPPDPDEATIRSVMLAELNDWRAEQGLDRLAASPRRRPVLDEIAADLSEDRYFEDPDARAAPRFSPKHRLGESGLGCANHTRGFAALPPEGDRQDAEAFGEDAAETLIDELDDAYGYRSSTVHDVGVHVTDDGRVYVAYVAC